LIKYLLRLQIRFQIYQQTRLFSSITSNHDVLDWRWFALVNAAFCVFVDVTKEGTRTGARISAYVPAWPLIRSRITCYRSTYVCVTHATSSGGCRGPDQTIVDHVGSSSEARPSTVDQSPLGSVVSTFLAVPFTRVLRRRAKLVKTNS